MKLVKSLGKALFRSLGYYPTRLGGLPFKCDPYHVGFWRQASKGWEPQTYEILSRFLRPDSIYYDVGAWIGPTAIFAARLCRQVVCFEPDPVAYQYLLWNIRLNELHNILPVNAALADRDGLVKMASFGGELGDSATSLLKTDATAESVDVLAVTWNTWMELTGTAPPTFIKIDIEGGEFALLPTIKEYLSAHKPVLYLSLHAPFLPAEERLEQMRRLRDVLAIYNTCLNDQLKPIALDELADEEGLKQFQACVLLD